MDEIEIFNRALAPEEIQAIFDAGSAGKCKPPDCNDNGVPDEWDLIEDGDFDSDEDVDLADYAAFADCMAGPDATPNPPVPDCITACLGAFDFDADADVDLDDFAQFQVVFGN